MNDSYSPSMIVRQMHQVPHLDSTLSEVNGDFDITIDSTWNEYTKSLLPMPIICMAIGLLAVLIFQITSCCFCCCKKKPLSAEYRDPRAPNIPLRNCWIAFAVFFVIVIVFDQSLIFGNKYVTHGVNRADDGLDYLKNTFTVLTDYGDDLTQEGDLLRQDFQNSYNINNCAAAASLDSYVDDFYTYVDEYESYVEDVPGKCSDAQDALHTYAVDYKTKTVWVFYGMFIVCLVFYLFAMIFSSKGTVYTGIFVTDLVMIFTFIICGVTMIVLMVLGDFCMEPTDNLLMIAPDSVYNVTNYYTTCRGENPMQPSLDDARELVAQGRVGVNVALGTSCPNDQYLEHSLLVFDDIDGILLRIQALIACPPNQDELLGVLNDGLCKDTYKGVYTIWLGMFVCAAGLFALTVIVACAVPRFFKPNNAEQHGGAEDGHESPMRPAGSAPAHEEAYYDDEPVMVEASPVPTVRPGSTKA